MSQGPLRYYEDLTVGESFESQGRTVTEADVVNYAGLSGDYNRLHTDAAFMRTSPFGERIAHGLLGVAISSGLASRGYFEQIDMLAHLEMRVRFLKSVRIGDTIRVRVTVRAKRETKQPGRGIVTFGRDILNQDGSVVTEGESIAMVARRPAAA